MASARLSKGAGYQMFFYGVRRYPIVAQQHPIDSIFVPILCCESHWRYFQTFMGGGTLVWKNNMNKNRISIFFLLFLQQSFRYAEKRSRE